jgi:hypothetical protein
VGLLVVQENSRAEVTGCLIDSTQPSPKTQRHGLGVQTGAGAMLRLHGTRVSRNRTVGLLARHAGTYVGVTGSVIEDTQPDLQLDSYGCGLAALLGVSAVQVQSSVLRRNHAINVLVEQSPIGISDSLVWGAVGSNFGWGSIKDKTRTESQLGDGILARQSPSVTVTRTLVLDNVRAGVVLEEAASSSIADSGIAGGYFGVVSLGVSALSEQSLAMWNNTQNHASPNGLYVPEPPSAVDEDVEVQTKTKAP